MTRPRRTAAGWERRRNLLSAAAGVYPGSTALAAAHRAPVKVPRLLRARRGTDLMTWVAHSTSSTAPTAPIPALTEPVCDEFAVQISRERRDEQRL